MVTTRRQCKSDGNVRAFAGEEVLVFELNIYRETAA